MIAKPTATLSLSVSFERDKFEALVSAQILGIVKKHESHFLVFLIHNHNAESLWTRIHQGPSDAGGLKVPKSSKNPPPIASMYGIYANIGSILMVNVTIYSSTMDPSWAMLPCYAVKQKPTMLQLSPCPTVATTVATTVALCQVRAGDHLSNEVRCQAPSSDFQVTSSGNLAMIRGEL